MIQWTIISQHVFKVSTTSMHTWSQMVVPLVNLSLDNVLFKVKPSLHQAFLQVIDITNLCFVHTLLYNTPSFVIYRSISMKLYDTSDAIFFGNIHCTTTTTTTILRVTALFPGPPGWDSARRELLDFMVQGKINRGRHTDHPAGRHSIWTKQCPPPPSPIFYRPDALPTAQPTVSEHWRQYPAVNLFIFWLSQDSVATLIRWGGWSSFHHVSFIAKSNSENYIKIY